MHRFDTPSLYLKGKSWLSQRDISSFNKEFELLDMIYITLAILPIAYIHFTSGFLREGIL